MELRAGWALRYGRALVLSSGALALAILAHVSAGGLLPDVWAFVGMLVVCTIASGSRLGREASRLEIVALLVVGQTVMHGVMTAIAGHGGDAEPPPSGLSHALEHAVEHLVEDMTWAHAPMMGAHLAAAIGSGLWLAYGERALFNVFTLVSAVTGYVFRALVLPVLAACKHVSGGSPDRFVFTTTVRQLVLAATHVRRGPPTVLGAF